VEVNREILWRLVNHNHGKAAITLIAGHRLWQTLSREVRDSAIRSFARRGITVIEETA